MSNHIELSQEELNENQTVFLARKEILIRSHAC